MNVFIAAVLVVALALGACSESASPGSMKTTDDSVSYAIGMNIGQGISRDSVKINPDLLAQAIKDQLAKQPKMNDSTAQKVLAAFQQQMMEKQQARYQQQMDSMNKAGEENKKKAAEFLEANKGKTGVVSLPNGLQYQVITEGTGPIPKATDNVKVNYRGTLIDGTEFDSSTKNGPATFGVTGVIPGWTQALKLMKVGSKWRLWIPPDLGYGASPPPGSKIPPSGLLIFEVELLEIVKGQPAGADAGAIQVTPQGGAPQGAPQGGK